MQTLFERQKEENIFTKFIKRIWKTEWKWVFVGLGVLLILYALYFAFCFKNQPSYTDKGSNFFTWRVICLRVICGLVGFCSLGFGFIMMAKKRLTVNLALVLIAMFGMSITLAYSFSTPIYDYKSIFNQHDVYYGSGDLYYMEGYGIYDCGGGHFGMIMTIFRYNIYPQIKYNYATQSYDFSFGGLLERYQPKLFYYISAYFMRFNSLFMHGAEGYVEGISKNLSFTNTEWALYESLRILYTFMEFVQVLFFYKILKAIGLKGRGLCAAFAFVVCSPMWCYFAHWTNNDGMSCFFAVLALYFAIKFVQERKWRQSCLCALFIGLSMACKLGGALIAIVIAPMLAYGFIKDISKDAKDHKDGIKSKRCLIYVLQMCAFAAIVFPLGLGFPIINLVRFGQPITYFSEVTNDAIRISNYDFFQMFLLFPNSDCWRMTWVYHGNDSATYIQDTSTITALIKTSLYGEYGFGAFPSNIFCRILLYTAYGVCFLALALVVYRVYAAIRYRGGFNLTSFYVLISLFLVNYGWDVYFVWSYPYTCNQDMRYSPLLILAFGGFMGESVDRLENENNEKFAKIGSNIVCGAAAVFGVAALLAYLFVVPWYYRD